MRPALLRVGYAGLFVIVLPVGLVLWAMAAEPQVLLPVIHSAPVGVALICMGMLLFASGALVLTVRGGGLPLNAYPPPHLVHSGIYRWIRSPIYIGFALVCAGMSIDVGSPAGLWLVTPMVCLAAAALVYGFERHDLMRRFGSDALRAPLLSLPSDSCAPPTVFQRVAVILWVLVPWLIVYYAAQALTPAPDAFRTALPFERFWPVMQWTELVYVSVYLLVPLTVLVVRAARDLRRYAVQGAIATFVVGIVWFTVPVVATNRPFFATGWPGYLLAYEQAHSNGGAAFPAFHVLWALLAADAWDANARTTGRPVWRWVGWAWAAAITISCITTGMHTLIEVAAAPLLFIPLRQYQAVWSLVRSVTERFGNSWKEWRLGPVRVMNHGAWAAVASGVGFLITASAAGRSSLGAVVWVGVCILVGAGLWAQMLEGSTKLLRPFGWYGGVLGAVFGALTARLAGMPLLPLLAAYAVAAPWIQTVGRLRCLVQGCCHGRPAAPEVGIRYHHRRSRVAQLASLSGIPVHATPLYSMAGNILLGIVLLRLRMLGAPDSLVVGVYLLLAGMARFVEESYRGEPQTRIIAGLRIYQWLAILSVLAGAVCTTLRASPKPAPLAWPDASIVWAALALALVAGLAMGVDFPGSNRRFSRLAPAD